MNSENPNSFNDIPGSEPGSQFEDTSKQIIREVAEYSRKVRQAITNEIKAESRSFATEQLNLTTSKLDNFADALREAAGKLREKNSNSLADIIEIGSKTMIQLSNSIKETSPETMIGKVEDFAHNRPGIFLGSAVVAGIFIGQLFSFRGEREGTAQEFNSRKESSIEYSPGTDEGEYYVPH